MFDGARLKGVAGVFCADIRDDAPAGALVPAAALSQLPPAASKIAVDISSREEMENIALFGEAEHRVAPRLGLIAGGRYDRETIRFVSADGLASDDPAVQPFLPPSTATDASTTFDAFLPKLGVVYGWTEDFSTGFAVRRGYRSGGTSVNGIAGNAQEFGPETTWSFEPAARSQQLDRRLTGNGDVFRADRTDRQVDVPGPSGDILDSDVFDAGSSELYGGEIELRARPIDPPELRAAAACVLTEFRDFQAVGADLSGNEFPFSPERTFAFGAGYAFERGFFVGGDASFTDSAFVDARNAAAFRSDSRFLLTAKAGWRAESLEIFAHARSLLDEAHVSQGIGDATRGTVQRLRVGGPLTVGLAARARLRADVDKPGRNHRSGVAQPPDLLEARRRRTDERRARVMTRSALFLATIAGFAPAPHGAAAAGGPVVLELNKLEPAGGTGACQAFVLIENGAGALDSLNVDLVMMDPDGVIARRLAVELGPLRAGKTSVKVFRIEGVECGRIGAVLLNDVIGCAPAPASGDCFSLVSTRARGPVAFYE